MQRNLLARRASAFQVPTALHRQARPVVRMPRAVLGCLGSYHRGLSRTVSLQSCSCLISLQARHPPLWPTRDRVLDLVIAAAHISMPYFFVDEEMAKWGSYLRCAPPFLVFPRLEVCAFSRPICLQRAFCCVVSFENLRRVGAGRSPTQSWVKLLRVSSSFGVLRG